MDDLTSEKEQIEQIRAWWAQYGGYVIGGIGLGVALLVGISTLLIDNPALLAENVASLASDNAVALETS